MWKGLSALKAKGLSVRREGKEIAGLPAETITNV
jgi:hypothetical protein